MGWPGGDSSCGTSHLLELLHPQLGCAGCPSLGREPQFGDELPCDRGCLVVGGCGTQGGSTAVPAHTGMMFPIPRMDGDIVGSHSALWAAGICSKVGLWDLFQPFSNNF